jgi:TetR/AcrR family transcriptional regulator, transcriptional repressor for nem operon
MSAATLSAPVPLRERGRPREFDLTAVLDAAVRVFRSRGYHAASMQDLRDATDLASGSIYKAFADKRALFIAAFDRYVSERMRMRATALQACSSGREKLRELLRLYALSSAGTEGRLGCLVVGSVVALTTFDTDLNGLVRRTLGRTEDCLADLVRKGCADGSLLPDLNAADQARFLLCLMQGMRVVGKTGRTTREMKTMVELALQPISQDSPPVRQAKSVD